MDRLSETVSLVRCSLMTPVAFTRRTGTPYFPLAEITPSGNLKQEVLRVLESHGVTCDRILEIMDDVKSDPSALERWFRVQPRI